MTWESQNDIILKIEDSLNVCNSLRGHKKIVQPKTIKSKINGCGIAPGNLVMMYLWWLFLLLWTELTKYRQLNAVDHIKKSVEM